MSTPGVETLATEGRGSKRPRDGADDDDPARAKIFGPYQEQPPTFKFAAPEAFANILATCIDVVEEAAGGKFSMSEEGDYFPGTQCRVCSLQSPTDMGLQAGMMRVLSIALQSGDCIATPTGDYHFVCILPAKSVAMMLGPKGVNMKQLEGSSGVHVHIEGDALGYSTGLGPSLDRKCTLKGPAAAVERALPRLVECAVSFKDHPWYPKWACRTSEERAEMYVAGEPVSRAGKLGLRPADGPSTMRVPRVVLPPGCGGLAPDGAMGPGGAPGGDAQAQQLAGCAGCGGRPCTGGSGCMGMPGMLPSSTVGGFGGTCGSMGAGMNTVTGVDGASAMGGGTTAGTGDGTDVGMGMSPMAMVNPMVAGMMANMGMMAMMGGGMGMGGMGMVPIGMMNPMLMNPMACMGMAMPTAAMMAAVTGGGESGSSADGGAGGGT